MIDTEKIQNLKRIGIATGIVLLVLIGYAIVSFSSSKGVPKERTQTVQTSDGLTTTSIEDFLKVYYTKEKDGENREAYKTYMTPGLYQQTVSFEDEPTNKQYAAYMGNQEFQQAIIYLNEEKLQAIVQVTYTVELFQTENNQSETVTNHVTVRLKYVAQDGKYLVDQMESVLLVDTSKANQITESIDSENRIID